MSVASRVTRGGLPDHRVAPLRGGRRVCYRRAVPLEDRVTRARPGVEIARSSLPVC